MSENLHHLIFSWSTLFLLSTYKTKQQLKKINMHILNIFLNNRFLTSGDGHKELVANSPNQWQHGCNLDICKTVLKFKLRPQNLWIFESTYIQQSLFSRTSLPLIFEIDGRGKGCGFFRLGLESVQRILPNNDDKVCCTSLSKVIHCN